MTQKELSEKVGVSRSWITRVEQGEIAPNIIKFIELAQALDMDDSVINVYEMLWQEIGKTVNNNHYDQPTNNSFNLSK